MDQPPRACIGHARPRPDSEPSESSQACRRERHSREQMAPSIWVAAAIQHEIFLHTVSVMAARDTSKIKIASATAAGAWICRIARRQGGFGASSVCDLRCLLLPGASSCRTGWGNDLKHAETVIGGAGFCCQTFAYIATSAVGRWSACPALSRAWVSLRGTQDCP